MSSRTNNSASTYNIYRVTTTGEPSIVIQSCGCCMLDKQGVLTKETLRTVQSKLGEQAARAIFNGRSLHFHMNMSELVNKLEKNAEQKNAENSNSTNNNVSNQH